MFRPRLSSMAPHPHLVPFPAHRPTQPTAQDTEANLTPFLRSSCFNRLPLRLERGPRLWRVLCSRAAVGFQFQMGKRGLSMRTPEGRNCDPGQDGFPASRYTAVRRPITAFEAARTSRLVRWRCHIVRNAAGSFGRRRKAGLHHPLVIFKPSSCGAWGQRQRCSAYRARMFRGNARAARRS